MSLARLNTNKSRHFLPRSISLANVLLATFCLILPSSVLSDADDTATVDWGRDIYMSFCVSCHGWTGKGDGPAGPALTTPPTNLTLLSARNGGKFPHTQIRRYLKGELPITAHGSREMPIWGKVFRRESTTAETRMQFFALAKFLESIQTQQEQ